MASHFEDEDPTVKECANCGCTDNLGRCTRCHSAWFCSVKCQKAYWPFHKEWCRKNDFADMIEKEEPKFAKWMRKHGKQAVVKDDEVDRIERKTATFDDMYGRANPKPLPPSYTAEDIKRMAAAEERALLNERTLTIEDKEWAEITVPEHMGMECSKYKWRQNQSNVEVFMRLPTGCSSKAIQVELEANSLSVRIHGEAVMKGDLFLPVKKDASTWIIHDGILEVIMLKRYRRDHYENGKTNADTFWFSVFRKGRLEEALQIQYPPSNYYSSEYEKEDKPVHKVMARSGKYDRPMIDRSKDSRF